MKMLKRSAHLIVLMMTVAFATLAFIGCGGGSGGSSSDGGGTTTSPEIALSSGELLFGNVVANNLGLRSSDRSVQITNTGTENLVMGQIAQADALSQPFEILNDGCSGASIAPNESCSVSVRFKPTSASPVPYQDSFDIPSNDADEPSLTVYVQGYGQGLKVTINKVDSTNHPNIKIIVSVTDGDNNPIVNLGEADFDLLEQNVSPPYGFGLENVKVNTPISAALDLDYSLSVAPVLEDIEQSGDSFIYNLKPEDEVAVTKFAAEIQHVIDFITPSSIGSIADAAYAYTGETNATKLYDAVYETIDRLAARPNERRCAIVVSDGEDILGEGVASTNTLEDVIANAQDNKIFLFTIGLGDIIKREVMQRMAVETGGQYFETADSARLVAIYDQISQILSNQYLITFTTDKQDKTTNSLKVLVDDGDLEGYDTITVTY
jgi:VWFA-related protein